MTETGVPQNSETGTPQGGILSPLLANIALTVLDEHLMGPWKPGGTMSTQMRRRTRVRKNLPNWRLVRYADLCRVRHKSAYADRRVMPTVVVNVQVGGG
jgi:RNA-directed DNA polymerase